MSIWEWILVMLLLLKLILIVVTLISPPTFIREWLESRFALHPQLNEESVTLTWKERQVSGDDKKQIMAYFNQAVFLKKYDLLPLRCETAPVVINSKSGNRHIRYSLYFYETRVDVFKEENKKVVAYYLSSDNLPAPYSIVHKTNSTQLENHLKVTVNR